LLWLARGLARLAKSATHVLPPSLLLLFQLKLRLIRLVKHQIHS
jgi:hypothetical protein